MAAKEARFGRCVILATDVGAAASVYGRAFGWNVIAEVEPAPGVRYLHVGPPSQPGVGVWFLTPVGQEGANRIGAQTGGEPLLVLYTDDLRAGAERAVRAGMRSLGEGGSDPPSRWCHLQDPMGNRIVLVELTD